MNPLSEAVRKLRALYGESQEQFARRIDRTTRTVARWESDKPPSKEALAMLHQRAMLDHREEAIKQGISQVIWDAMTKELGETGINKIAEVWNLAVQARKNWHGGQPGLSRENVPELIDKIIAICVDIHPALAWHHEEARKHEERGWKKK